MNGSLPDVTNPLNSELFAIPLEVDRYVVYAPLRRAAFVANAALVNEIADLASGVKSPDPHLASFLSRLGINAEGDEVAPSARPQGAPEPTAVTLFLTTACNLRCSYCYASAGDTPTRSMSLAIARQGINFVSSNAKRRGQAHFEVAYHGGGEPSMNWHVMVDSHAYALELGAKLGLRVVAAAASNGMLNDSQIEWMIKNLRGVSVSFDGLPAVQDKHRIRINGNGSSRRVEHTLRRFDAVGFAYGIRVTVTRDQIAALPAGIEYIWRHFKPERIQVEPSYQLGRWSKAPSAETQEFINAYREAQARARELGRDITYSAARLDTLTNHFCGISQDTFALSPDGNVSACYEVFSESNEWAPVFFYGNSDAGGGYRFDMDRLENLRRQSVDQKPHCNGCFAKWHCAGDCHHKALSVEKGGNFKGSDRCHITRELVKDQIMGRIAASGGVFWTGERETGRGTAMPAGKELLR